MKIALKSFAKIPVDTYLSSLRRALQREGITTVSTASLYLLPQLDKEIRLSIAKKDHPIPGSTNDDFTNFDFA